VINNILPASVQLIGDEIIKNFILSCLAAAPQRPQAKTLLNDKFFTYINQANQNKVLKELLLSRGKFAGQE